MATKDPFGDLALAGGLVKKSMAEQKASSMAKQTPPTPPKPAADGVAGSPAPAGYMHSAVARPSPPKGSMGTSSKNSSTGSLAGLVDDPFAGLGGLSKPAPMAAHRYVSQLQHPAALQLVALLPLLQQQHSMS